MTGLIGEKAVDSGKRIGYKSPNDALLCQQQPMSDWVNNPPQSCRKELFTTIVRIHYTSLPTHYSFQNRDTIAVPSAMSGGQDVGVPGHLRSVVITLFS